MTPRQIQRRRFLRAHLNRLSVSEMTIYIAQAFYVDRHKIQKEIFFQPLEKNDVHHLRN